MTNGVLPPFLRAPLTAEQQRLLQVVYDGFSKSGNWPIWQYVDLTLDAADIDAAATLASLPRLAETLPGATGYALVATSDHGPQPQKTTVLRLTVAGLRLVPGTEALQDAFLAAVRRMTELERDIVPDPARAVEASLDSKEVSDLLWTSARISGGTPPGDRVVAAVGGLLEKEPLRAWAGMGTQQDGTWQMRLLTGMGGIRTMRGVESIDDYVERLLRLLAPAPVPAPPRPVGPLDLPQAIDYLDVVWKLKTGQRLLSGLYVASCGRLAQPCTSAEDFNPAMSALADVFASVVPTGKTSPPRSGALAALREALPGNLEPESKERVQASIDTLRTVVVIRNGQQHSDAKSRAAAAFQELGIPYPPYEPAETWAAVVGIAQRAVDAIREEIARLPDFAPPASGG